MKSLVKRLAVALAAAAAGIPNAVLPPSLHSDRSTEDVATVPGLTGETGLSFEELRVGPMGKVPAEIGPVEVPTRVAANPDCRTGG